MEICLLGCQKSVSSWIPCVYVSFIWAGTMGWDFGWEISTHCMVIWWYHLDLISLFGPPQKSEHAFVRRVRILLISDSHISTHPFREGNTSIPGRQGNIGQNWRADDMGQHNTFALWRETQDSVCIVCKGCATTSFKIIQSKGGFVVWGVLRFWGAQKNRPSKGPSFSPTSPFGSEESVWKCLPKESSEVIL